MDYHVSRSSGLAKTIYPTGHNERKKRKSQTEDGKTISKSGQEDFFASSTGAAENGQDGSGLLRIHLW